VKATESQNWDLLQSIEQIVQVELALLILGSVLGVWISSKTLLRRLSEPRKQKLKQLFQNLNLHLLLGIVFFLLSYLFQQFPQSYSIIQRIRAYIGLITIFSGATIFIKTWRILVFQYLFLSHMKMRFPVLLVNLFTLIFSSILGGWLVTEIFNIQLTSLLATSAIFSLVLGLALQDVLGNLFAGVALQLDKAYEIGDWIEVQYGSNHWIGRVSDISWRATGLKAWCEESVLIPNRIMAQAEISNFSTRYHPIIRIQKFRFPFGCPMNKIKNILLETVYSIPEISKNPAARVSLGDITESWIEVKLIYHIYDYSQQFTITDRILTASLILLQQENIPFAIPQLSITPSSPFYALPKHTMSKTA